MPAKPEAPAEYERVNEDESEENVPVTEECSSVIIVFGTSGITGVGEGGAAEVGVGEDAPEGPTFPPVIELEGAGVGVGVGAALMVILVEFQTVE